MRFTLIAVALGFVLALLAGGRPRYLSDKRFRWWLLLPAGLALQLVAVESLGDPLPFALLLLSYACLVAFGLANLRLTGVWMIVLGFTMNAVVIGTNHGMPVGRTAIRAIGARPAVHAVKHHTERHSDQLVFLADIIPVTPLGEIVSFGDVILAVGVIDVLVHLMRPARRRREEDWDLTGVLPLLPTSDRA